MALFFDPFSGFSHFGGVFCMEQTLMDKLTILADSAKYDVA